MSPQEPLIIAHRANSGRIVSWYKRLGVKWVEVDAYWDKENREILVGHPPSPIQRASIPGRLFSAIDYLFFYRNPFYGKHSLREWAERLGFVEGILLDLKNTPPLETLAIALETLLGSHSVIITSSNHDYLLSLRQEYPWVNIAPSISIKSSILLELLSARKTTHISILYTLLDRNTVLSLHERGVKIIAWTVNSPRIAAHLASIGVDYIVTDRPDKVKPKQ